jgi:hypothetical protein
VLSPLPENLPVAGSKRNRRWGQKDRATSSVSIPLFIESVAMLLILERALTSFPYSFWPAPLIVALHGGNYNGQPQTANFTFLCSPDAKDVSVTDRACGELFGHISLV